METEIADLLGEHAVSVLVDIVKFYEFVIHSMLLAACQDLGYPMRLAFMLVAAYQEPRTLRAYGSLSEPVVAFQGMLAGCSHATTLARVLLTRVLKGSLARSPSVTARALIDDVSFQWTGPSLDTLGQLWDVIRTFCAEVKPLGFAIHPGSGGFAAKSQAASASSRAW